MVKLYNTCLGTYLLPDIPEHLTHLPPLPEASNKDLERVAFTHTSVHQLPRRPESLTMDEGEKIEDYEKLEHVGDGILGQLNHGLRIKWLADELQGLL
jgi:hypothetical protein